MTTITTAHDVRHLAVCSICRKLCDKRESLEGVRGAFYHGRCYVRRHGRTSLWQWPNTSLEKLTLDDIGVESMKLILEISDHRNKARTALRGGDPG